MMMTLAAMALSYLLGSFPSAIVIGRLFFGRDPRNEGSGNSGCTNAFRVFGWKADLAVVLPDVSKGAAAASFSAAIFIAAIRGVPTSAWLLGFAAIATPLIDFTHRANIGRLVHGEGKRFEKLALLRNLLRRRQPPRS